VVFLCLLVVATTTVAPPGSCSPTVVQCTTNALAPVTSSDDDVCVCVCVGVCATDLPLFARVAIGYMVAAALFGLVSWLQLKKGVGMGGQLVNAPVFCPHAKLKRE